MQGCHKTDVTAAGKLKVLGWTETRGWLGELGKVGEWPNFFPQPDFLYMFLYKGLFAVIWRTTCRPGKCFFLNTTSILNHRIHK